MSRRKALSFDQKRSRMLDLLFEKMEPFSLKELEKIAPKEKGIRFPDVKEVLQSLVDDSLVETDKVGSSVFYWAFQSKAGQTRQNRLDKLKAELEELEERQGSLNEQIKDASVGKESGEDRTEKLQKYSELRKEIAKLDEELQKYKDFDPEVMDQIDDITKTSLEAANRWTDNIFNIQSYCTQKLGILESDFNKNFGIPEDFDYVS
eukprot:gb/GECH01003157.1/.p1 GENE.gb/GECH01003157.1/~~gb/GECH01003157.1/.p1  ORF type:complete len:206 (+),score=55.33 gb/GECH01003157.1/:1-618(+)